MEISMRVKLRKLLKAWRIRLVALMALYCFVFVAMSIPVVLAQGAGKVTSVVHHTRQNYAVLDNGLEIAVGQNHQLVQAGDKIEKDSFSFSYAVNGTHINALPYEAVALLLI